MALEAPDPASRQYPHGLHPVGPGLWSLVPENGCGFLTAPPAVNSVPWLQVCSSLSVSILVSIAVNSVPPPFIQFPVQQTMWKSDQDTHLLKALRSFSFLLKTQLLTLAQRDL